MKIGHIGLWCKDLEVSKEFYTKYFCGTSNNKYENHQKGFSSYFIKFDREATLELMHKNGSKKIKNNNSENHIGFAHVAFSVGSISNVNKLTNTLRQDGYHILDGPRRTGDGYYESVVLDPDENRIEITI